MKLRVITLALASFVGFATAIACGAAERTPEVPAPSASASAPPPAEDGNRALTRDECGSLGQWIVDACNARDNLRDAQIEGWCADKSRGMTGDATWIDRECVPHIRTMDAMCMKSTTIVRKFMDCERSVSKGD